jgi:hypothetical protein
VPYTVHHISLNVINNLQCTWRLALPSKARRIIDQLQKRKLRMAELHPLIDVLIDLGISGKVVRTLKVRV